MEAVRLFRSLDRNQRNTFLACFLGWALDAFDFFLLTFVLVPVGHDFGRTIPEVAFGITLTLMMRPLGALIFGLLGDKFGRRIPLMGDIIFGLCSHFSAGADYLLPVRCQLFWCCTSGRVFQNRPFGNATKSTDSICRWISAHSLGNTARFLFRSFC